MALEHNSKINAADEDKLPRDILRPMVEKLGRFIRVGQPFDGASLRMIDEIIKYEAIKIRQAGFKFPQLVAVILEQRGWIEIVRADLEHAGIQRVILNLIRRYPDIQAPELVVAISRAFPNYKPDSTGDAHDRAAKRVEKRAAMGDDPFKQ